jgi:ParB family chromosome partitioning protein
MARRGLGKGLDALIPGEFETEPAGNSQLIPVDQIFPNPSQPRTEMDDANLEELADSIREHGVIQPLILTQDADSNRYTLIAGERRLRAAKLAGLESVPAVVRQASDLERLELALVENIQRENLSPLESAHAYLKLQEEFGLTQDLIAEKVSKSRTTVTNTIRLLKLPEEAQKALREERISEGHARALLGLTSSQAQLAALQTILRYEMNVRQAEELVRKLSGIKPKSATIKQSKSAEAKSLEARLREQLGTKVSINETCDGGTIVIHYYSEEELESILNQILG